MKKLLSCFLALLLTVSLACAAEITVAIPDQKELVEEKYVISVDIADNPGFASAQLELSYNSDVLTCERVLPGEVLKGLLTDSNPKAGGVETSAILSAAGTVNTTASGSLATFVFEKPKSGDPKLRLNFVELMTAEGKKVDCTLKISDNYGAFETTPDSPPPGGIWTPSVPTVPTPGETVIHDEPAAPPVFSDTDRHWAREYIAEAVSLGIVKGLPDGTFAPDKAMTRAEFATLLWNIAKQPSAAHTSVFSDVPPNAWYSKQIAWAFEKGYINGISAAKFDPNGTITREQAMTILHRYAGSPGSSEKLDAFSDKETVSAFAYPAMCWAVEQKIISGVSETALAPKQSATRAQLAAMIVRYLKK